MADSDNLSHHLLTGLYNTLETMTGYEVHEGTHETKDKLWERPYIRIKPEDTAEPIYRNGELKGWLLETEVAGFSDKTSSTEIMDMFTKTKRALSQGIVVTGHQISIQRFEDYGYGRDVLEEQQVNRFNLDIALRINDLS